MPILNWLGKEKVINHHQQVPYRVLEQQYTYGQADSGNMIIHGDNLDALKALLPRYEGKVKCIYIDPPYNTGNESWVYNDNVNDPKIKKWLGEVVGREGEDLSRHDKWLCMMYPRLRLLQRLLSDDGAIFISINSVESAVLRLILDEIFGTSNFVTEIACINNPKGRSDDKYFATAHETIFVYRKTDKFILGGFAPGEHITKRYNKNDGFERYREIDLRKTGDEDLREDRPDMFYPFIFNEKENTLSVGMLSDEVPPGCIKILPMKSKTVEGRWRWGIDTARKNILDLNVRYMPNKKQWGVFERDYLSKKETVRPTTCWDFKDVNSERGTELFIKYLGFSKSDFPNPKPVGTIERIVSIATNSDSIILDSFAGSGTTAHAVLNLNKSDGGSRKFILVEMEDYADNITAERVKRVINGYGDTDGTGGGFSYYELGERLLLEDGNLNENLDVTKICEYIWYTETRTDYVPHDEDYLLGIHANTAYYFYYEKQCITILDHNFLHSIKTKIGSYLVYADINTLSAEEMDTANIRFKKIPRDITKI